jgi:hypothetical protein
MKYVVGIAVDGRVYIEVEADDFTEAREKANNIFMDMDLGQLECIEWKNVNAEDENGNMIDY